MSDVLGLGAIAVALVTILAYLSYRLGLEDGYERRTLEYNVAERLRVYGSTERRHHALGVDGEPARPPYELL